MPVSCQNCGAEVAEGQRFCRQCGREVRLAGQDGELPTRIFPAETPSATPFNTSRLSESRTDPVFQPRQTAPHPYASQPYTAQPLTAPTTAQPLTPPRSGHSRTWLYVMISLGILAVMLIALLIFAVQSSPSPQPRVVVKKNTAAQPGIPAPPASASQPGAMPLDENEAEISDSKTVITRDFPLTGGASVSLKNVSGDIEIDGWDEDHAEVRVIKHGGSPEDREQVRIVQVLTQNKLSLETPLIGNTDVEVQYQLKLPRNVSAVSISSLNSEVKLSEINGSVAVDLQKGSIELHDIGGVVKAKTVKGDVKAELGGAKRRGAQEFSTVKGNVELQFEDDVNADIKAETVDGKIEVDDDLNLQVTKQPVGQHVAGHIGSGGDGIIAKTVNGNIKLKK